jgi:hypothetical protein
MTKEDTLVPPTVRDDRDIARLKEEINKHWLAIRRLKRQLEGRQAHPAARCNPTRQLEFSFE